MHRGILLTVLVSSATYGQVSSGVYLGNSSNPQTIGGVGFSSKIVIVDSFGDAVCRTSTMPEPGSKLVGNSLVQNFTANAVQTFTADGFTVSGDANNPGAEHHWMAVSRFDPDVLAGTYPGNGTSRSIPLGMTPALVIVMGEGNDPAVYRSAEMVVGYDGTNAQAFDSITLSASGFSVGSHAGVNRNNVTFHFVVFPVVQGRIATGSYKGNGTTQVITTNFPPSWVFIRESVAGRPAVHRFAAAGTADRTHVVGAADAGVLTGAITSFTATGFTLGSHASVNDGATAGTYHWFAFGAAQDGGSFDAGSPDAGAGDGDAGVPDAGMPDGGVEASVDAGMSDAARPRPAGTALIEAYAEDIDGGGGPGSKPEEAGVRVLTVGCSSTSGAAALVPFVWLLLLAGPVNPVRRTRWPRPTRGWPPMKPSATRPESR